MYFYCLNVLYSQLSIAFYFFFKLSPTLHAGYEKYNSMRADPTLCFLERVGMPDAKAIAAEQRGTDMLADGGDG